MNNALYSAVPPLTIYVDSAEVVTGWTNGEAFCTSSSNSNADLWRTFWDLLRDIGEGICILKCKAHCTEEDVLAGESTPFLEFGNDHADLYAAKARESAEDDAPTTWYRDCFDTAVKYYRYLIFVSKEWQDDTEYIGKTGTEFFVVSGDDCPKFHICWQGVRFACHHVPHMGVAIRFVFVHPLRGTGLGEELNEAKTEGSDVEL